MPYAEESAAETFYGSSLDVETLKLVMRIAGRTVSSLAKAPDPATGEFTEAAADAELLIGRFIVRTDFALLKSKSLSGVSSKSYTELDAVKSLAASALGEFYSGSSGSAVGYISSFPMARG